MTTTARIAALVAVGALTLAGLGLLLGGTGGRPTSTPIPSPVAAVAPASVAPSIRLDYHDMPGRLLVEHLGNALDLSEADAAGMNPDTRRLYFMDPADMGAGTSVEFLPGTPARGKSMADVSFDDRKVVFQDWGDQPNLFEANLDGTGFREIPIDCTCHLAYPDYDPTATKIVYTRIQGSESWLETYDLESGEITPLETTRGPRDNAVPEQPAWSPDGATIAFNRITWLPGHEPVVATVHYGDVIPASGVLSLLDVATGEVRDLPIDPSIIPGDANWSPDSRTLVYTGSPGSTTGSVSGMSPAGIHRIDVDGGTPVRLQGWGGPEFLADGEHILYQDNTFYVMRADGTEALPVNSTGLDLSDGPQGFTYIGHWIDED